MTTKAIHILMLLAAISFGCIACSDETAPQQTVPVDSNGQVKIMYKIAGSSLSRATEDGWNEGWNENEIDRIDLFVFDKNDKCVHHIVEENIGVKDAQEEDSYTNFKKDGTLTELTYEEVEANIDNYSYYMVANCPSLDGINKEEFTLDNLKEKLTPDLVFNQPQKSFAMDGKIEETPTPVNNTITLKFELKRAAVKIRLSVNNNQESIIKNCKFQLFKYVDSGTSVLNEAESYGEIDRRKSMDALEAYNKMTNYENEKVIFYSYPNDWFDESLLNENGTFSDEDIYAIDDLIDEEKQTYILLEAPYGEGRYYYKVPVNFAISKDNDKVEFSKEDIENLRNGYYRMLRNHIYDITVTIDREGGTVSKPVTPKLYYQVLSFDEETIDIPKFQ